LLNELKVYAFFEFLGFLGNVRIKANKAKKKQTHANISVPANMAAQPKSTQARMTASAKKTKTNSEDH
jgi:hypothetical protein